MIYGIAIGAGYHRSVGCGVAIGVALLAECIPHKITDFTLLTSVGMTKSQALKANFFTRYNTLYNTLYNTFNLHFVIQRLTF